MIAITLPDGSKVQYNKKQVTPLQIAESIGMGLARAALAAKVNGKLVDLSYPITKNAEIKIITSKDDEGKEVFRHSSGHVMSAAVNRLYKNVKQGVGPAIEDGFYQDFELHKALRPEDLPEIEKEMRKIVKEDLPL